MQGAEVVQRRYLNEAAGIGLSVCFALFATWLMLLPAGPEVSPRFPHLDKLAHFVAFFFIALPALAVRPADWLWIVVLAGVLGGAIEIIQPMFGRGRELADFIADVLGALAAVPVGRWLSHRLSKLRQLREREGT